jgi:hypothetical protein
VPWDCPREAAEATSQAVTWLSRTRVSCSPSTDRSGVESSPADPAADTTRVQVTITPVVQDYPFQGQDGHVLTNGSPSDNPIFSPFIVFCEA